jgi:hypothetical protein
MSVYGFKKLCDIPNSRAELCSQIRAEFRKRKIPVRHHYHKAFSRMYVHPSDLSCALTIVLAAYQAGEQQPQPLATSEGGGR